MNSHYEKIGSQVRCIDDEIPFELPAGWEWCRLGRMSLTLGGFAFASGDIKSSTGIRVIRISDFNESGLLNHKVVRYNGKQPIDENYVINQYDILMAMTGGTVGKSVLLNTIPEILYLNQRVANIRSLFSCPQYLFCVLSAPHIQGIVQTRKNSTNDNISMEDIRNFPVPLPPLSEQYRILAKLEKILPLVDKYGNEQIELEKINSDIKDLLRKSILQEAIQGKLVPQDPNDEPASELLKRIKAEKERLIKDKKIKRDKTESVIFRGDDNKYYETIGKNIVCIDEEIPFEIPDSWCWTRLAGIAELYTGDSINEEEKKLKFMTGTGRYYIGTKDVGFDHKINYKNGVQIPSIFEPVFRIAPKGSVLMCVEGGSAGRKIAILNETVCFGNKLCCFSPFGEYAMYIYYYLQSPAFFSIFSQNKTGIIGGVSLNTLKSLIIPLPPKQEINRIVQKIDELFAAIN
ncbi:MAG: restriction endonuclease subunit S [Candidatus Cryptobacteroides sp.]